MDRRRSPWFAMDSSFLDGRLGVMIRERFGITGIVLWLGFLSACKRSPIPGQIQYGSVPDALSLMGVPGMDLVDESGVAYELQSFWRALAAHKQCSSSTRGRLTQVRCTNWRKWQEDFGREKEATRKASVRAMKTPDTTPPTPGQNTGQSSDDPPLAGADLDSDLDSDLDLGSGVNGSSSKHHGAGPVENEEEDSRILEACRLVAERRLAKNTHPPRHPDSWKRAVATKLLSGEDPSGADLHRPAWASMTAEQLADLIEPLPPKPYRAFDEALPPAWDIDANGNAVPARTST